MQRYMLYPDFGGELLVYYCTGAGVEWLANRMLLNMFAVRTVLKELFRAGEIFDCLFYGRDVFVVRLGEGWLDFGAG